ncbi:hypothetical protein BDV98DRAFT_568679 [Pterulicium gracile]|uniref:Uncharacterized protein n=1 Tax=Pterulicium gracile TaxID=1884261 RepID=A0A5C3QFA9_9AGAR|nr:hypothetical protein BDV98DRAFT_568679 [Pterula gracilis]
MPQKTKSKNQSRGMNSGRAIGAENVPTSSQLPSASSSSIASPPPPELGHDSVASARPSAHISLLTDVIEFDLLLAAHLETHWKHPVKLCASAICFCMEALLHTCNINSKSSSTKPVIKMFPGVFCAVFSFLFTSHTQIANSFSSIRRCPSVLVQIQAGDHAPSSSYTRDRRQTTF